MKDLLQHRGYYGSAQFDNDDLIFHGKIEFIRALVTYEATDAVGLKQAFEAAVEDYLDMCERNNMTPEKPFKGSFNVRVKPEVHRMLAVAAQKRDISINKYVADTLESAVKKSV